MQLALLRTSYGPHSTLGKLSVDGEFFCYTLEDRVHDGPKIPGETAIPEGGYDVVINMSNRFKRRMPLLVDVPGFAGVRIHAGNTHENTEGCVLVGMRFNASGVGGQDFRVDDSRVAFDKLFALLDEATDIRLTIGHEVRAVPEEDLWGGA